MVRTNQRGSVVGFVVIGAVMALLLIGGAYVVRHNLGSRAEESPVAVTDQENQSNHEENTGENSEDTTNDTNKDEDTATTPDDSSDQTSESSSSEQGSVETSPEEHLPETGISGVVLSSLFIGSFAGIALVYLRSRSLPSSL